MNYERQEKGCSVRLPLPLLRGESWARFMYSASSGLVFFQRQENIITLSYLVEIKDWCEILLCKIGAFSSRNENNWILLKKKKKIEKNLFYSNSKNLHPRISLFMGK